MFIVRPGIRLGVGTLRTSVGRHVTKSNIVGVRWLSKSNEKRQISTLRLGTISLAVGAALGVTYALFTRDKKSDHQIHQNRLPTIIDKRPTVKIVKEIRYPSDNTGLDLVLFQFQTCPFCCKVRTFLDFHELSYSVVEVDAVLRQDLKWSDYRKVPIVLARTKNGKYVQLTDSSTIMSVLTSFLHDSSQDIAQIAKLYPEVSFTDEGGAKKVDVLNKYFIMYQDSMPENVTDQKLRDERKWRSWADNELVHLISPNVYRTRSESFETFRWFSEAGEWDEHFPHWERELMVYVGATAMWLISKRLKKKHGLSDDVRGHIFTALDKFTSELKLRKTKFLGGDKPNLADLSVFGVLCSMEGCAAFKDCLNNTEIGDWFYRVKEIVNKNKTNIL